MSLSCGNCQSKPEIHDGTLALIAQLRAAHQKGGKMPLVSLVTLFGALNDHDQASLKARGNIVLTPSGKSGGTFSNKGPVTELRESHFKVEIPATISGTYTTAARSCHMAFDAEHTISIHTLLFRPTLLSVDADQDCVHIEVSNASFNQCFAHS